MKKSLLLGAMALAASAATTAASAAEYGFYTSSGSPYCDGVKYSGKAPAVGFHVYDQVNCVYPNGYLGGYEGSVKALGAGKWFSLAGSQATGDGLPSTYTLVYYINPKALTWALAYESADYSIAFAQINAGTLVKGKPSAMVKPGAKHLGSTLREALASLKK